MTRRRFYAPRESFADEASVTLGADETRHLRNVLRLKAGDEVYVFDGDGREFRSEIAKIDRSSAQLIIEAEVPARPESPLNLTLGVALLKGEKFDLVLQKAVELGVTAIVPTMTSRADVKIKSAQDAERMLTRWRRIALEATKQCGRVRLMKVEAPITFSNLVGQPANADVLRLMFAERAGAPFENALADFPEKPRDVTALIGSEGGFSDEEIDQAREADWKIVTLGGRIMRAETAAIATAALLQHRLGDLR